MARTPSPIVPAPAAPRFIGEALMVAAQAAIVASLAHSYPADTSGIVGILRDTATELAALPKLADRKVALASLAPVVPAMRAHFSAAGGNWDTGPNVALNVGTKSARNQCVRHFTLTDLFAACEGRRTSFIDVRSIAG